MTSPSSNKPYLLLCAILAAAGLAALFVLISGNRPSNEDQTTAQVASERDHSPFPTPESGQDRLTLTDTNVTLFNKERDLWGLNRGNFNALWWEQEEGASEYLLFRAPSVDGLWEEVARIPLSKGVDLNPEVRKHEFCYRVEALNASGTVTREYKPVCIPSLVKE